jgi:hypothetical protein
VAGIICASDDTEEKVCDDIDASVRVALVDQDVGCGRYSMWRRRKWA